jgi:hypothetical protein
VAVAYDRSIADSHLQLAHALKLQGKKKEALAAYIRAIALDLSLEGARFELAQLGWREAHLLKLEGALGKDISESRLEKAGFFSKGHVVLTSCGRQNLLSITLDSFLQYNTFPIREFIILEDGDGMRNGSLIENIGIPPLARIRRMTQRFCAR